MARPPKRPPPMPKADRIQKAKIRAQVYCPSCDRVMLRCGNDEMCCKNSDCDMCGDKFEVPTIELVSVKEAEPEPEVPGWPHPDSLVAKLLGWPESMKDAAKVKELRERLREIEWVADGHVNLCPVCGVLENHLHGEIHRDHCWLKVEIDQLEQKEASDG